MLDHEYNCYQAQPGTEKYIFLTSTRPQRYHQWWR